VLRSSTSVPPPMLLLARSLRRSVSSTHLRGSVSPLPCS
jgi:hypothetical protein